MKGCFCPPNTARVDGKCVKLEECPEQKCPEGEEWTLGNDCQDRCGKDDIYCSNDWYYGCFCRKGLVRVNGKCVEPENCHTNECSDDREWLECGSPCQDLCDDGTIYCKPGRCIPGCYCKEGFVEVDGKCVRKEEYCQEECCGANEEWQWGSACSEKCEKDVKDCFQLITKDCYCKKGYVRIDGKCVPVEECPNCGEDRAYDKCRSPCDWICPSDGISCSNCDCVEGCFCPDGQIEVKGRCWIKEEYCATRDKYFD